MTIITRKRTRNKDRDYVSGPQMHQAIVDWYTSDPDGSKNSEPPKLLVDAVIQICDRLATRNNFSGYTYLDEMVAEGKLSCITALIKRKYNPEKSDNPFAYFSMIAWNAFIQVIKNEHKETYIKHKELENHVINSALLGENIELEVDDSGRLDKLIEKFEGKDDESKE